MKKIVILLCALCAFSQLISGDTLHWSGPVAISTPKAMASDPQVVMDGNTNVTAIWVENTLVMASSQPVNGSWSVPTQLSNPGASSPKLGMDSSGNVTALWLENGVVNSATLSLKGSWSVATIISSSGASSPALAVDPTGNAVAVWVRNGVVESSTQLLGGSWGSVSPLTNTPSSSPDVAIGANGTVVAIWNAMIPGFSTLQSASASIGGSWNPAVNVLNLPDEFTHNFPKVVVDRYGEATALWLRYDFNNGVYEEIFVSAATLHPDTAAWGAPTILANGGQVVDIANISTRLAIDSQGNAIGLWCFSYDGSTYNIESSFKLVEGNWSPPIMLQIGVLYAFQIDVAANNALGDAAVAYMVYDGVSSSIIISHETNLAVPGFKGWTIPTRISQGVSNGYPQIATCLNENGIFAAAVWVYFDGISNEIVAARGSKTVIVPPTNLAVRQDVRDFGVFTNYYNTISWTLSSAPNIVKYNIYRNGFYFTSVDPYVTQVIDYNAIQNAPVIYGIAAEDASLSQSLIAEVSFP